VWTATTFLGALASGRLWLEVGVLAGPVTWPPLPTGLPARTLALPEASRGHPVTSHCYRHPLNPPRVEPCNGLRPLALPPRPGTRVPMT